MTPKQFLIIIGAGVLCALLLAAPGLYQLSKEYKRDKAREEASRWNSIRWNEVRSSEEYRSLTAEDKIAKKNEYFNRIIAADPDYKLLSDNGKQELREALMQAPDDNGQGYFTSFIGSLGRGAVAILPWCFDQFATWNISPGFTEFAGSVRGGVETIFPVNPLHAKKWPMKLAFWLGFAAPPVAFFVIRARRTKGVTT